MYRLSKTTLAYYKAWAGYWNRVSWWQKGIMGFCFLAFCVTIGSYATVCLYLKHIPSFPTIYDSLENFNPGDIPSATLTPVYRIEGREDYRSPLFPFRKMSFDCIWFDQFGYRIPDISGSKRAICIYIDVFWSIAWISHEQRNAEFWGPFKVDETLIRIKKRSFLLQNLDQIASDFKH